MAEVSEKQVGPGIETLEHYGTLEKPSIVDTRVVLGDEAYNHAMLKEPPRP